MESYLIDVEVVVASEGILDHQHLRLFGDVLT